MGRSDLVVVEIVMTFIMKLSNFTMAKTFIFYFSRYTPGAPDSSFLRTFFSLLFFPLTRKQQQESASPVTEEIVGKLNESLLKPGMQERFLGLVGFISSMRITAARFATKQWFIRESFGESFFFFFSFLCRIGTVKKRCWKIFKKIFFSIINRIVDNCEHWAFSFF